MLYRGKLVPRPEGTWARYFMDWTHNEELTPVYGTDEDLEHWLVEYDVSPEAISTFQEQLKRGAKGDGFMFDIS